MSTHPGSFHLIDPKEFTLKDYRLGPIQFYQSKRLISRQFIPEPSLQIPPATLPYSTAAFIHFPSSKGWSHLFHLDAKWDKFTTNLLVFSLLDLIIRQKLVVFNYQDTTTLRADSS